MPYLWCDGELYIAGLGHVLGEGKFCTFKLKKRSPVQVTVIAANKNHFQCCSSIIGADEVATQVLTVSSDHGPGQRRYRVLPTMHCLQWDILYRWSCVISAKVYLKCKIGMISDN